MSQTILQSEHVYGVHPGTSQAFAVEMKLRKDRKSRGVTDVVRWHEPEKTVRGVATQAYVNHGRWIADCPFCASAQVISTHDRRFFCVDCGSVPVKHAYIEIEWPQEDDIPVIEKLLLARPNAENRNWYPVETVDALRYENRTLLAADTKARQDAIDAGVVTIFGRHNQENLA